MKPNAYKENSLVIEQSVRLERELREGLLILEVPTSLGAVQKIDDIVSDPSAAARHIDTSRLRSER